MERRLREKLHPMTCGFSMAGVLFNGPEDRRRTSATSQAEHYGGLSPTGFDAEAPECWYRRRRIVVLPPMI